MPVDLSKIGLEGQESFYSRMESAARTRAMDVNSEAQAFETVQSQRLQQLSDVAAAKLNSVVNRDDSADDDVSIDGSEVQSSADPLAIAADVFMRGGAPKMGMDLMKAASEIQKREADIRNDQVLAKQRKLENIIKGADIAGRALGKAQNQSEWDAGLRVVEDSGIIEPHLMEQLRKIPYDPNVAAYFLDQAISASDKARLDMAQAQMDSTNARAAVVASQTSRRIQLQEIRDKETTRHNRAVEKAGGGKAVVTAPSERELKSTRALLKTTLFNDTEADPEELNSASEYVATQAKQIIKENDAIDWTTAVQQATMRAQQSGVFSDVPGTSGFFGLGGKPAKVGFDPSAAFDGKSPAGAMAMPATKSALKKGAFYITAKGRAKWNGSAFEAAD
jgi:hypothetical protein